MSKFGSLKTKELFLAIPIQEGRLMSTRNRRDFVLNKVKRAFCFSSRCPLFLLSLYHFTVFSDLAGGSSGSIKMKLILIGSNGFSCESHVSPEGVSEQDPHVADRFSSSVRDPYLSPHFISCSPCQACTYSTRKHRSSAPEHGLNVRIRAVLNFFPRRDGEPMAVQSIEIAYTAAVVEPVSTVK